MKNIKLQKIYTYPDRILYGEYCAISLLELRIKIVKKEIKDELCFIDENERAYCFDQFGIPESFPSNYLDEIQNRLLRNLLGEQMKLRDNLK